MNLLKYLYSEKKKEKSINHKCSSVVMLGGKNKSNRRVSLVNLRFDNVLFRISCLSICFLGVQISWSVAPLGRELLGFNLNAYSLFELYYDIINAKGCTCFLLAILWFTWIA